MSEEIITGTRDGIGFIRIHRPAKKNALTTAMYASLADALEAFDRDESVSAVRIAGGVDFTAGNDLEDFMAASLSGGGLEDTPVLRFLDRLRDLSKPIVAAVRGNAVGIGTTMLLHCDAIVAGKSARFRLPFVQLGIVPEAGSTLLLPLTIGRARAAAMLLTGDLVGADEALAIGLVNVVTDDDAVEDAASAVASRFASAPPEAVRETKRLMRAPWAEPLKRQMNDEAAAFARRLASPEFRDAALKLLAKV